MWQALKTKLKGWKTVIWHGAVAASGTVLLTIDQLKLVDFSQFLTPTRALIVGTALGLVGIWLRFATNSSVGQKTE